MKFLPLKFRLCKGLALGAVVSLVGLIIFWNPGEFDLEEQYGLEWLFRLRGSISPPTEIVIVTVDRKSARKLGLSDKPDRWPRSLHGQLIEHLQAACAKLIVFDLFFREAQLSSEDKILAQAMRKSGNVALIGHLGITDDEIVPYSVRTQIQTLYFPISQLSNAAVAVAPFILPNTAHGITGYWPFMTSAADLPTLPTIVFYQSHIREILYKHLQQSRTMVGFQVLTNRESIKKEVLDLRSTINSSPSFGDELLSKIKRSQDPDFSPDIIKKITGFIHLLKNGKWIYLNYYGPPGTIKTVGYAEIIETPPPNHCTHDNPFFNKIVLIGISESSPVEQKDKDIFETVFPGANGLKMSGVEIMATAINNLIENSQIRRVNNSAGMAIILIWGILISIVWRWLKTLNALILTMVAVISYFYSTFYLFQTQTLWLPLVIPLIQTIFAVPIAIAGNRADLDKYIKSVHDALSGYLPPSVIERVIQSPGMLQRSTGEVYGTCLHTDVTGFTSLCSKIEPLEIGKMMAVYYQEIARPVMRREGIVADQTGDSMLAIWATSKPDIYLRHQACEGALDIADAVKQLALESGTLHIPTRIGLHVGRLAIGEIRFGEARQLRSFGPIVNLSQRLDNLNILLGTQILVSDDAINGLNSFLQRPVGVFLLKGMKVPLKIFELVGRKSDKLVAGQGKNNPEWLCESFSEALESYTNQQWQETIEKLIEILEFFPEDGPALFYLKRTEFLRNNPNSVFWDPVIYL